MSALARLALLVLIAAGSASSAEEPPPAPEPGVATRQLAGARIVEAVLPGRAVGEPVISAGGLAILTAAGDGGDGPRSLHRFDPAGEGTLVELARDLPPDLDALAGLDLDGDGRVEILAGAPGRIYSLGSLADPETGRRPLLLLEARDIDLGRLRRRGLIAPDRALAARPGDRTDGPGGSDGALLPVPSLGRLDLYRWTAGALRPAGTVELPVRARRRRTGLELSTPPVHLVARPGGPPLVAAGPEAQGKRRLLTTLIDPADSEAAGEIWARLSANERIAQSWYLSLDGSAMLAVAALSADKLGIFEKKKLRLFPLRGDRTRAGAPPALQVDTATRNWYSLGVEVADLDLDGRDDLIVLQPDGLGAKKLAVEAYRGKGNGGFFLTPRRSVVVAPFARWAYGQDLDGDGIPDLAAVADGRLLVFRGLPAGKKALLVKKPAWSFAATDLGELPDPEIVVEVGGDGDETEETDSDTDEDEDRGLGRPRVADLDGDGLGEIVLRGEVGGRALLRVVKLR